MLYDKHTNRYLRYVERINKATSAMPGLAIQNMLYSIEDTYKGFDIIAPYNDARPYIASINDILPDIPEPIYPSNDLLYRSIARYQKILSDIDRVLDILGAHYFGDILFDESDEFIGSATEFLDVITNEIDIPLDNHRNNIIETARTFLGKTKISAGYVILILSIAANVSTTIRNLTADPQLTRIESFARVLIEQGNRKLEQKECELEIELNIAMRCKVYRN